MLEGLTTGASRIYAVVLIGIVPLLVAALGTVYLVRRRNRKKPTGKSKGNINEDNSKGEQKDKT